MDADQQRFAVFASVIVIALLVASNLLLLVLVLRDDDAAPGKVVAAQTTKALPALPAPTAKSTGSKALLRELRRTQRGFAEPIDAALGQLGAMSSSTATLDQLPVLLQEMVVSTSNLDAVAPGLQQIDKRMRSLNRQIKRMSSFMVGLGPVMVDLETIMREMRDDLDKIRVCNESPSACK